MSFDSIPDILDDLAQGRMVVILDDEDRENEGDLIMAASKVRPEDINFMARYARGLICLALTPERCRQLALPPIVRDNRTSHGTAFTVSIEAASGVTTGISAYDRAHTIRTAVRPDAQPGDLVQPGHIFPLQARPGGVLTRAGHTEASVDLALLSGSEPAGVLVEIMSEDGSMARTPELLEFARQHGLRIGTIEDLIRHRLSTEQTVVRHLERAVDTPYGPFRLVVYRDLPARQQHYALVRGTPSAERPCLVRVHAKNWWSDVLALQRADFGLPLRSALQVIAEQGEGVVVVLGERSDDDELLRQLGADQQATQEGPSAPAAAASDGATPAWRQSGIGAQILRDLGLASLTVLGTPRRFTGLSGFGLTIDSYRDAGES